MELQNNQLTNLPLCQAEYVRLRVGNKSIKDLNENELKKECVKIIGRAFLYTSPNGKTDEKIVDFQSLELYNVLKKFGQLTIPEVQQAFAKGLNNEYGQYFGLCGKTYHLFVKSFFDAPERSKAWLAYLDEQSIKRADKPGWTIDQSKPGLIEFFNEYKKTGKFPTMGELPSVAGAYYDLIKTALGVKSLITLEQFKALSNELKPKYMESMALEKAKFERRGETRLAESCIGRILAAENNTDTGLNNQIKKAALKLYFDSIEKLEI